MKQHHAPPYLHASRCTKALLLDVCIALTPPSLAAVWFFGWRAVWMLLTALSSAFVADRLSARLHGFHTDFNNSALVTGTILALSCPPGIPLWLLALACVVAIAVFRDCFGGMGANLFNPAMAARALLITIFPAQLSQYASPDAVSTATPLTGQTLSPYLLFFGKTSGAIGETSGLLILLGGTYLIARKVISPRIPLLSLAAFSAIIVMHGDPLLPQLLSGGLLFGSVYVFTDYTGSPVTPLGEALFAVGAGALTAAFRLWGRYPEGVCFAVLTLNLITPSLDHLTRPRAYGMKRRERSA